MKRLIIAGTALALMTGWAAAQTPDPNAPPPPPMQTGADPGGDDGAQGGGPGGPGFGGRRGGWDRGWGHGMQAGNGGPDGMRGPPPWWRHHGHGMMMPPPPPPKGAVFSFKRGHGRGAIVIRCAEEDTTHECAEAVLPLLHTLMPNRDMAEHGDAPGQTPAQ